MTEDLPEATPFEFMCVTARNSHGFVMLTMAGSALEALLAETARSLFETSHAVQERYTKLTKTLAESTTIPTASLQEMLELKDAGEEFKRNADDFRTAIRDLLQEEGDMAAMYLTDLSQGKVRKVGDDDQIELLLEMYVRRIRSAIK